MATPVQLVDALNADFGRQPRGARAVHAKGVVLTGVFTPSNSASSLSKAPHLQTTSVPITVRFSNFADILTISDTDGLATPRGVAIKFRLPNRSDTDIVTHSYDGFPVATADEFRDLLIALASSGSGAAKPTKLNVFLSAHPIAKRFLESQISPLQADEVAKADPDYLSKEIRKRIARGAVRFKLLLEIADRGDDLDDPSIAWSQTRTKVELGTIEIILPAADNAAAERKLLFDPGALPSGIEPQEPIIKIRSSCYPVPYDRCTRNA
jgi:catalase